jgi:hypothetical protein
MYIVMKMAIRMLPSGALTINDLHLSLMHMHWQCFVPFLTSQSTLMESYQADKHCCDWVGAGSILSFLQACASSNARLA